MDDLLDHLGTLNDLTPRIQVGPDHPARPDVVFGLDTKLFLRKGEEGVDWEAMGGEGKHEDELEVVGVRRGGKGKGKRRVHEHQHTDGEECGVCHDDGGEHGGRYEEVGEVEPIERDVLEKALAELTFEIYRGKHRYFSSTAC